MMIEIAKEESR
ncbi:hypothetical protein JL09_g6916 [Pichia kudriavzevii]|uniref:Uncharacterized protein n=1 Tax=Pichia kudriavzevii TaxID=4909 RepID=A0A099NKP2_PICKU|nr:hypothetical protein JL09_g6916 [Pichia kudriavzevii]